MRRLNDTGDALGSYAMGMSVQIDGRECGKLDRVVLDPDRRSITHLVVEPAHAHGLARLVPIELAHIDHRAIRLTCTLDAWRDLPYAREVEFNPPFGPWTAPPDAAGFSPDFASTPRGIVRECVPDGEIEICRGEHIHAADGSIGHVEGIVANRADGHVVRMLLSEGHLRHRKTVAVPLDNTARLRDDGVHVELTKRAIRDLPDIGSPS